METNFFKNLTGINPTPNVEWVLVVKQGTAGNIVVSLLYKDTACGDNAAKIIPPLVFSTSPEKIDACFFADVTTAMGSTVAIISSMAQYQKQQEKAKQAAQGKKAKDAKTDKHKADVPDKYAAAMQKADALEAEGKFRDAWMKVPSAQEFPEHAEAIRTRKAALSAQFDNGLFSTT
jgi:PRTRC genetic system protein E